MNVWDEKKEYNDLPQHGLGGSDCGIIERNHRTGFSRVYPHHSPPSLDTERRLPLSLATSDEQRENQRLPWGSITKRFFFTSPHSSLT
jgi:hypothetical protein